MAHFPRAACSFVIEFYHRFLSPFVPPACRFYPSCSLYAAQAVQKYGIFKGVAFGLRRLSRCHAWSAGGDDPVK